MFLRESTIRIPKLQPCDLALFAHLVIIHTTHHETLWFLCCIVVVN